MSSEEHEGPEREEPLTGGNSNMGVVRVGDTVRRAMTPRSPTIHRLLRHLEAKGFTGCPRLLGVDERGREILTYLPGDVGFLPYLWEGDDALIAAANLLRGYHDAVRDFKTEPGDAWSYAHPDPSRHEIICHNDFAPYNWVCQDEKPYAAIDFDDAGPGPRLRDVAYAVYWMAPLTFGGGPMAEMAHAELADGSRRLKLFCSCYGVDATPELLNLTQDALRLLRDWIKTGAEAGDPARARMVEQGQYEYWELETRAFAQNRPALERSLFG
ncbi:aminoglycoside phosphotransferase family protein [Capsulimonas corticalis]|nr:aminoglycoside phosphotransferase family protein [Capsulimonas corticalis]